jgi:Ca2+-binding EF-hand superfamily protein
VITNDPDVTKEQISASFSEIDSDEDKNLSLGELLVFYFDLNLNGGLKAGLMRLINQFDKNRDNQINYVEIFGAEEKV